MLLLLLQVSKKKEYCVYVPKQHRCSKKYGQINRTSLLEIIDSQDFASIVTPEGIAVDTIMHFIRGRLQCTIF